MSTFAQRRDIAPEEHSERIAYVTEMQVGGRGKTVWIGTGAGDAVLTTVNQSHSIALTNDVIRTLPGFATTVCCKIENKLFVLYSAGVVLRRILMRRRQWPLEVRFWRGMCVTTVVKLSSLVRGKDNVMLCIFISQPSSHFLVEKDASPFADFDWEITGQCRVLG